MCVDDGRTALSNAVTGGHRDVALVLMEHGASSTDKSLSKKMLKALNKWMAEALREKNKQMEEMVRGIPEWCAQAASAVLADEGKNADGVSSSSCTPANQVQPTRGVGRKRKAPYSTAK